MAASPQEGTQLPMQPRTRKRTMQQKPTQRERNASTAAEKEQMMRQSMESREELESKRMDWQEMVMARQSQPATRRAELQTMALAHDNCDMQSENCNSLSRTLADISTSLAPWPQRDAVARGSCWRRL